MYLKVDNFIDQTYRNQWGREKLWRQTKDNIERIIPDPYLIVTAGVGKKKLV